MGAVESTAAAARMGFIFMADERVCRVAELNLCSIDSVSMDEERERKILKSQSLSSRPRCLTCFSVFVSVRDGGGK
jgi:hypothetical protein